MRSAYEELPILATVSQAANQRRKTLMYVGTGDTEMEALKDLTCELLDSGLDAPIKVPDEPGSYYMGIFKIFSKKFYNPVFFRKVDCICEAFIFC